MNKTQSHTTIDTVELFGSKARIRIIRALALESELGLSQILKKTRLNYSCAVKHLKYLESMDLIQEKTFGRTRIFRFKIENYKAKALKNLIEIYES